MFEGDCLMSVLNYISERIDIRKSKYYGKYQNVLIFQNLGISSITEIYFACQKKGMSEEDTFWFFATYHFQIQQNL